MKALDHLLSRLAMLLGLVALAGCDSIPKPHLPEAHYHPSNVFYKDKVLDPTVKRVAVLPMTTSIPAETLQAGIDLFQPLVNAELEKSKRFDLFIVSKEQMRLWTGRVAWKANDELPPYFLDKIRAGTDCQAVFFTELTRYHAYPPLAVGWKMTLVQNSPQDIIWAADEVFDAGDADVAASARDYDSKHIHIEAPLSDPESILSSPSRFGQYTLHELLALLPIR
jgi:hypothetical protein